MVVKQAKDPRTGYSKPYDWGEPGGRRVRRKKDPEQWNWVDGGNGLGALLEPLARLSPHDRDLEYFARLGDDEADVALRDALYRMPELRQTFAYRVLYAIARAMMHGAGFEFSDY